MNIELIELLIEKAKVVMLAGDCLLIVVDENCVTDEPRILTEDMDELKQVIEEVELKLYEEKLKQINL